MEVWPPCSRLIGCTKPVRSCDVFASCRLWLWYASLRLYLRSWSETLCTFSSALVRPGSELLYAGWLMCVFTLGLFVGSSLFGLPV